MNRAIHAETLKTRLDDDGQLTGYLDEMINDCPSVRPDMNSAADEFYTADLVKGDWETVEKSLEGLNDMRRKYTSRSKIAALFEDKAAELVDKEESIFIALRKGIHKDFQTSLEKYDEKIVALLRFGLSAAGFLQIDVEKCLRGKHAYYGD